MKKKSRVVYFLLIGLGLFITALQAQPPQLLNYQGKLNTSGAPASGSFSIVFSIYSSATGTTALWSETQNLTVASGVFNVLLGSVTPFPGNLFAGTGERHLGIKVGADPEMTPRFRLTSVPFASRATEADGVADGVIVNADVNSSAAIDGTKVNPNFGAQNIATTGSVNAGLHKSSSSLGSSATPETGGVYADNLVYAWGYVDSNGTLFNGFGCTVAQAGTGTYNITYKKALANNLSFAPIAISVDGTTAEIMTIAASSSTGCTVKIWRFDGSPRDSSFFFQVVGRP